MDNDTPVKQESQLPEAPASATARVVSTNNFHWLFTLRSETGTDLLEKLQRFELRVISLGWKPENGFGKGEEIKMKCKTCDAEAYERKGTSKNGKPYHAIFCSSENRTHTEWL